MIPANGNMLLAGEDGAYQISKSVRLRASVSAYLNRTLSSGSATTWTWSGWVKRGTLTSDYRTLFSTNNGGNEAGLRFNTSTDVIELYNYPGSYTAQLQTSSVYRDTSAWMHIVAVYDSTNATSTDRIRLYVNGVRLTAFGSTVYPSSGGLINTALVHNIGGYASSSRFFDGYLAEIHFIDGQALTPTSFGETDTISGVWNPKKYAGTYGTNGFYLKFDDTSSFGKDSSGNSNTFTSTNISNIAGSTYDSMVDSPTNYGTDTGVGGEVRGNYAVVSPVTGYAYASSNGNLTTYGGNTNCYFSMPVTGKMYFEAYCSTVVGGGQMGFVKNASIATNTVGYNQAGYYGVNYASGAVTYWVNGTNDGINHGTISGNTLKFAVDGATGKVWIGSGSTWFGSGDPANGTNPAFTLSLSSGDLIYPMITSQSATYTFTINTGQTAFANAAPSGFKAMCTQNMTTPSISKGGEHMSNLLWQGTGNTGRVFTGVGFKPDLVWVKDRSAAYGHVLFDSVRGAGGNKELGSQSTGGEGYAATSSYDYLSSFDTDGFTSTWSGSNSAAYFNTNTHNYVAWNWKAGQGANSNIAIGSISSGVPSIASTVSVNATAGFSIVTYTGTGVNATIAHGLGITPSMIIVKAKTGYSGDWIVWQKTLSATERIYLNYSNARDTGQTTTWNSTLPSNTVFNIGTNANVNTNTATYVAYCFAAITGYSAFGSYIGTGQPDGAFAYCGFRPRFVMVKAAISGTGDWFIFDAARDPYNWAYHEIYPNAGAAENSSSGVNSMDILSNGFKMRTTSADRNASGVTFIYAAFAENPFNISRAR